MKKITKILITILLIMFFLVLCRVYFVMAATGGADFDPNGWITPTTPSTSAFNGVVDKLQQIGSILSVIVLIVVGIKYMLGSIEEKAEYKKTMAPYVIGAIFVFAISNIVAIIKNTVASMNMNDVDAMGNQVIMIIATIGSIISVIMLIVLGIKYMLGSIEEKATYKKSMVPYVIGAFIVFAASTIASIVYQFAMGI